MAKWQRSDSIPFPKVWSTFEGKGETNKKVYWIQDITDEYLEDVLRYMTTQFMEDEPLCKYSRLSSDSESLEEFLQLWRQLLSQRMGLICLTKDQNGTPIIAGMNCTYVASKNEKPFQTRTKKFAKIYLACKYMTTKVDPFTKFGIKDYLSAMGLFVLPAFRGEGIGVELLKARKPLCEAMGLKATLTVFSSDGGQAVAQRAGFKDLFAISYDEFLKTDEKFKFPGIEKLKGMKFMYLLC